MKKCVLGHKTDISVQKAIFSVQKKIFQKLNFQNHFFF